MTFINDTWRFLVQRRLLPVVIVLIAAAAAVPMLLAKDPVATPAPSAGADVKSKSSESALTSQPIVALAGDGDRAGRRRVLGSRKNPFEPQATPEPTPGPEKAPEQAPDKSVGATPAPTGGGGGAVVPPTLTIPGQPGVTAPEKKRYELFELTVRFGASDGEDLPRSDLKRLEALPSADEPVLIYLGVLDDKKTAVFLVDSGVVAQGDGTCRPSRTTCETIHLKEGETEFFDVVSDDGAEAGQQYQLDLVKIRRKSTSSAKQAKRSRAKVSKAGTKILRARIAGDGPLRYRFDRRTGRLHKLSKKSYRAAVAKAARAARAHF